MRILKLADAWEVVRDTRCLLCMEKRQDHVRTNSENGSEEFLRTLAGKARMKTTRMETYKEGIAEKVSPRVEKSSSEERYRECAFTKNGVLRGKRRKRQTLSDARESTNWEGLCGTPSQMVAPAFKLTKKVTADKEGAGPQCKDFWLKEHQKCEQHTTHVTFLRGHWKFRPGAIQQHEAPVLVKTTPEMTRF